MPRLDHNRLSKAVNAGFKYMEPFREIRKELLKQYYGRHYGSSEGGKKEPVALVHQATTTLVPNLVYSDPKVQIVTSYVPYRNYAETLAMATNHLIEEIDLRHALRMAVTDSIFSAGWIKTGIAATGQTIDVYGMDLDPGQPYAERVDPDDMVYDPTARDLEEVSYIGNRVRIPEYLALESGLFDPDRVKELTTRSEHPSEVKRSAAFGEANKEYREEDVVKYVDVVELWLPHDDVIVTIPWYPGDSYHDSEPLSVVEYMGPETGPYHQLGYAYAPDQIMPVAPAVHWYDLHDMVNSIARKMGRQASRSKSVLAYEDSSWEDAQEIVEASDGEAVRVDNIEGVKEVSYGGAVKDVYDAMSWAKQQFHETAMGMQQLAGVESPEETATQAEILSSNTGVRLSDMQSQVYDFTAEVCQDLMFFLHTDPLIEMPLVKRVDGREEQVFYTPEMQEGDWLDYHLKVIPHSMARQDPNTRLRRYMEFVSNVLPSLAQTQQMLGPAFNLDAAMSRIGREMGIDELDEFINSQAYQQRMQYLMGLMEQGIPMTQDLVQQAFNPMQAAMKQGKERSKEMLQEQQRPGGGRTGQPNPRGNMRQGITPETEFNQRQQQTAADAQRTYTANPTGGLQ